MKTYLFIDGTNLDAAQYELFGPKKYLNFSKFIRQVEKKLDLKFSKVYFYASFSPKLMRGYIIDVVKAAKKVIKSAGR